MQAHRAVQLPYQQWVKQPTMAPTMGGQSPVCTRQDQREVKDASGHSRCQQAVKEGQRALKEASGHLRRPAGTHILDVGAVHDLQHGDVASVRQVGQQLGGQQEALGCAVPVGRQAEGREVLLWFGWQLLLGG